MTIIFLQSHNYELAQKLLSNKGFSVDEYNEKGHYQIETNAQKSDLLSIFDRHEFHERYDCRVVEGGWTQCLFDGEWLSEWDLRGSKTGQ